jgi:hypothetical protein
MGVKRKIRNPKFSAGHLTVETIWKFKILNFQNRVFGWDGPKSELLLKQPLLLPFDFTQGRLSSGQAQ